MVRGGAEEQINLDLTQGSKDCSGVGEWDDRGKNRLVESSRKAFRQKEREVSATFARSAFETEGRW